MITTIKLLKTVKGREGNYKRANMYIYIGFYTLKGEIKSALNL